MVLYIINTPVMNYDPNGTFVLSALIIGAIVGGVIGFGAMAYADYKDDGKVFNGSVKWHEYLGATALGAGIGALVGMGISYIVPHISSFMSTTFNLTLGGGGFSFGSAATLTGGLTLSLTGTQVLAGVGALATGLIIMFAKGSRPRMGHNQYEKQQIEEALRQLKIKDHKLRELIHRALKKYPYAETLQELIEIIKDILGII